MTLEPSAASAKAKQVAESLLAVVEAAVPKSRRAGFQGTIRTIQPDELAVYNWTRHLCASDPGSELYLGSTEGGFSSLATLFDLNAGPDVFRDQLLKMLRQWFVQVFDALGDTLPRIDWTPGPSSWTSGPPFFGTAFLIDMQAGDGSFGLGIGFTPALLALLEGSGVSLPHAPAVLTGAPVESDSEVSQARSPGSPEPLSADSLGLLYSLLDIELPVSIVFGRAQVPLGELVKYGPGTIVELDRSTSDPVEILIHDHVVARGEVVAIDGNYGVRIEEVISTQDRIRMTAGVRPKKDSPQLEVM